jgi:hypothetical protein
MRFNARFDVLGNTGLLVSDFQNRERRVTGTTKSE